MVLGACRCHNGQRIERVPTSCLLWLVCETPVSAADRMAVRAELQGRPVGWQPPGQDWWTWWLNQVMNGN